MVAVPSPLSVKVNVGGKSLDSVKAGVGPDVVTVKLKGLPTKAVAVAALVKEGWVAWTTLRRKWLDETGDVWPRAHRDQLRVVRPGSCAVPEMVPVPSSLSMKLTPSGNGGRKAAAEASADTLRRQYRNRRATRRDREAERQARCHRHARRTGDARIRGRLDGEYHGLADVGLNAVVRSDRDRVRCPRCRRHSSCPGGLKIRRLCR